MWIAIVIYYILVSFKSWWRALWRWHKSHQNV